MKKVRDRFSGHAPLYEAFRPLYPKALYDAILDYCPSRERYWDCATGNGQVARALCSAFREVEATDVSTSQLSMAPRLKNITYRECRAEKTAFEDNYFDLITVAQAIHWFDIPAFLKEAERVGNSGAVLAVWGYGLLHFGGAIDTLLHHFYMEVVGPYWDGERALIDKKYSTIPFNLREAVDLEGFSIEKEMTPDTLKGYLTSWSSVQNYIRARNVNPVEAFMDTLKPHWEGGSTRTARFPLFGTMGRLIN